jgi:hypothetical protein
MSFDEFPRRPRNHALFMSIGVAIGVLLISIIVIISNDPFAGHKAIQSKNHNEELRQMVLRGELTEIPKDIGMTSNGTPVVNANDIRK